MNNNLDESFVFFIEDCAVRYQTSRFGGELRAIYRGYCPFSSTGYRSCAGFSNLFTRENIEEHARAAAFENAKQSNAIERELDHRLARPVTKSRRFFDRVAWNISTAANAFDAALFMREDQKDRVLHKVLALLDRTMADRGPFVCDGVWTPAICRQRAFGGAVLRKMTRCAIRGDWSNAQRYARMIRTGHHALTTFINLPEAPRCLKPTQRSDEPQLSLF